MCVCVYVCEERSTYVNRFFGDITCVCVRVQCMCVCMLLCTRDQETECVSVWACLRVCIYKRPRDRVCFCVGLFAGVGVLSGELCFVLCCTEKERAKPPRQTGRQGEKRKSLLHTHRDRARHAQSERAKRDAGGQRKEREATGYLPHLFFKWGSINKFLSSSSI